MSRLTGIVFLTVIVLALSKQMISSISHQLTAMKVGVGVMVIQPEYALDQFMLWITVLVFVYLGWRLFRAQTSLRLTPSLIATGLGGMAWLVALYLVMFAVVSSMAEGTGLDPASPWDFGLFKWGLVLWLVLAPIVICALFLMLGLHLARPVLRLSEAVARLAGGDFGVRLPQDDRRNEIAALSRDINFLAERLETAREERREMLASICHDQRVPLTIIMTHAELLRMGRSEEPSHSVEAIWDQVGVLKCLMDDLSVLSELENHQRSWHLQKVDLSELVRREVASKLPDLEAAGMQVEPELPEAPIWVDAVPDKLRRVLANLLENARKYGADGGWIGVSVRRQGAYVKVEVMDRGPGIDPGEREHLFRRFYRGSRARAGQQGGSGLGLAIALEIVERHSGRIGVDRLGGGETCFWFILPAQS